MTPGKSSVALLECTGCGERLYPGEECPECGDSVEVQKIGTEEKLELRRVVGNPDGLDGLSENLQEFATKLQLLQAQGYELGQCSGSAIYVQLRDAEGCKDVSRE